MAETARRVGRPSTYNPDVINAVLDYINGGYQQQREVIPTMAGCAKYCGMIKPTLIEWAKEHDELANAIGKLKDEQELMLVSGGLSEAFGPAMCKLILATNHGYSEKTITETNVNVNISDSDAMRRLAFALHQSQVYDVLPEAKQEALPADISQDP